MCYLQLPEHSRSWSWGYKTIWVSQSHQNFCISAGPMYVSIHRAADQFGAWVNSMGRISPLGAPIPHQIMGEQPKTPCRQGVPGQHLYPGATLELRCPQDPQAPELAVTGITHSKCFTPQACPLPAPNTLCTTISSKENKFCISSTGQAIQGLRKVSGVWIGKHRQNQQADGLSFWFRSPPLFMTAWPVLHLFTVNKLSGHIIKAYFGSVRDPQSTNLLKLVVQRKFSLTPPPSTLKYIHLSGPKCLSWLSK